MTYIYAVLDECNQKIEELVNEMKAALPGEIGLDPRCGVVYVNDDCIIVPKHKDATIQYYGGFEYVDKDFRHAIGDYVIYLAVDDRISGHIDRFYNRVKDEVDDE